MDPIWIKRILNPFSYVTDRALWYGDTKGLPSNFTNAARDLNQRAGNAPWILANAAYNYYQDPQQGIKESFKQADTNPRQRIRKIMMIPKTNTEENYSDDELEQIRLLDKASGGQPGDITYAGYRLTNKDGKYAANSEGGLTDPQNVIEWSLGQTGHMWDENGNPILHDVFAYDLKDTLGVYLKKIKEGSATPMMYLRGLLGTLGSIGYRDGSNSYSAIKTRIPVSAYQK